MKENKLSKLLNDWQVKVICLLLGTFTYFLLSYFMTVTRTVTVPLKVVLPTGYEAVSNIPETVEVDIKGTEDRVYMVNMDKIGVISDFSCVSEEGVASAPVVFDLGGMDSVLSFAMISLSARPSSVRIYFEEKEKAGQ